MKYQLIPGTDLSVSSLILGTDYYGKTISEASADTLLDVYCENGGNLIDTAHVYSDYLPGEKHLSEKVIGRWLRKSGKISDLGDSLYVATKGGFPELDDMHASRLSFAEIRQDLDESLECLQTECIDLYWLHRDNPAIPAGEITEWMNEFLRQGKIKHYGFSNWTAARLAESLQYAEAHGLTGPVASQIKWSLAVTNQEKITDDTLVEMNREEYDWYCSHSLAVFAYSSQAKGFFSKLRKENGVYLLPEGKAGERHGNPRNLQTYEKLLPVCARCGMTPAQASLAWILHALFPVFPIVGCKTEAQLRESLRASDFTQIREFMPQEAIFQD